MMVRDLVLDTVDWPIGSSPATYRQAGAQRNEAVQINGWPGIRSAASASALTETDES